MPENDVHLPPDDESKLEFLIHNFWIPEWHIAKINIYIHHLENFDEFNKEILKLESNDDVDNGSLKDCLILEIITSTMFLTEMFAAIAQACLTNPKNIQKHLKEFKATNFYADISSRDDNYYAQILSMPQIDYISGNKEVIFEGINDFKQFLNEIKEYYFSHLDLFNSYKHGLRLFPVSANDENNEPFNCIMYFSNKYEHDQVKLTILDKNPRKHQEFAKDMIYFIRLILKNHQSKLKKPDGWEMTMPIRNKDKTKIE